MFGREHGVKIGSGGMATDEMIQQQRKTRLRNLASEIYDIDNDPYFFRNTTGKIVCRLCETSHANEQNYIVHTNATKHRQNLILRNQKLKKDKSISTAAPIIERKKPQIKKVETIGKPGYSVYRQYSRENNSHSILFRVMYPEIAEGVRPRFKFMSSFEQKVEPTDSNYQYLLMAAEPYETIAYKIPSRHLDRDPSKLLSIWNSDSKEFLLQIHYTTTVYHPSTSIIDSNES